MAKMANPLAKVFNIIATYALAAMMGLTGIDVALYFQPVHNRFLRNHRVFDADCRWLRIGILRVGGKARQGRTFNKRFTSAGSGYNKQPGPPPVFCPIRINHMANVSNPTTLVSTFYF